MNKLGIDIGYSTFKYIYLNSENEIITSGYVFHRGNIQKHYEELIKKIKSESKDKNIIVGITGNLSERLSLGKKYYVNNNIAAVEGALYISPHTKSVIELGAQETKYFMNISSAHMKFFKNTSCSSGSGSFIEEQALRLSIDIEKISHYIEKAKSIPRIAGRCSVFSKTDMIHHMQDGETIEDILNGLCYALVRNFKGNVIQKNKIETPVMLIGGVMKNKGVVNALKEILRLNDKDFICEDKCQFITCYGACKIAEEKNFIISTEEFYETHNEVIASKRETKFKCLKEFGIDDSSNKHVCTSTEKEEGYVGIDIGSTSTNFVVIDNENKIIDYLYVKTNGKPKDVVLENFETLKKKLGEGFKVKGIAVTGSGREYIGKLINADCVVNEITAQAEGAISVCSDVDTIFEIGGQDSKYINIENKLVKDFEMNKICAAGTGAFIEEQIKKLDIGLDEFGDIALNGGNPCDLGDRCTVFIEGNIGRSIGQGESIENISSGLAYSIVKNYLNKVVGRREIGKKIFLQGGIAYNQAVVNAFRSLLGREIIVPPFFSVTGALGAAVLCKKKVHGTVNENNDFSAYELGNKYFEAGYVKNIDEKKKTVGIPRVLFINKMFPMFNEIFKRLGYNVVLSDVSNEEIIRLCQEYSCEETCFPVKLINGHVAYLVNKKVDYIFLPHLHTMKHSGSNVREDYACVYMQTSPKLIESIFNFEEKNIQLISPVLSFNFGKEYMIKTLLSIGEMLGKNKIETTAAVMAGMKKFMDYEHKLEDIGADILKNTKEDEKVFVLISRIYNIVDPVLNMGVEKHLRELGYKVVYLSHLEASKMDIADEHNNMYWPFGQHLLTGARVLKKYKNLYPVYITNHGCGPDTVLMHYMKKELEGRPYLHLEVDEHSSKVGVITRVEAFVNSVDNYTEDRKLNKKDLLENNNDNENQVLIPSLYPYSNILKAFLERKGKKAVILDEVNENSIEDGKMFARSKEYFSLIGLLAEVMNKVKKEEKAQTLYLPTDEGSEVFGQYGTFIKEKINESGRKLNLESSFIEDYLGEGDFGLEFMKAIILGDIINCLDKNNRDRYLKNVLSAVKENDFNDELFESTVNEISKEFENKSSKKKILAIGEPLVVYKDYLNSNTIVSLEEKYDVIKEPLSEVLYIMYLDYSNKRNKINKKYKRILTNVKKYIDYVNFVLKSNSPFNEDISEINEVLKDKLPIYSGGSGRYRLGKLLTYKNADGIINLSSMYENTESILRIIRIKYKDEIKVPVLDLSFDCNIKQNNNELLETFTAYI